MSRLQPQAGSAYLLAGPTASGKTGVAHRIALEENAAVCSTDSMLIYHGMNIGTAKPTVAELDAVPYYGVNLQSPEARFSTGHYLDCIRETDLLEQSANRTLIAAGGTGLYIRALCEGLDATTPTQRITRDRLQAVLAESGVEALQEELKSRFPGWIESLADANNPRRVIRAIERAEAGESPKAEGVRVKPRLVGLHVERDVLLERIKVRVDRMYTEGLLEEVEQLKKDYPVWSETARAAIGYREALEVLENTKTVAEAKERTRIRTAQLAKRQRTWLRNQCAMDWVACGASDGVESIMPKVYEAWDRVGPTPLKF